MSVVEQRGIGREPFLAHQLLGIQAPVRTAEAHMSLSRNLPSNPVVRHIVSVTRERTLASVFTCSCRLPGSGPGLAPARDAGFLVRRPAPAIGWSYLGSTGVRPVTGTGSRPTGGTWSKVQQVDRSVDVPVQHEAAHPTIERPLGQRQAWLSLAAPRAGFAGRIPPVDSDQLPAVPGSLIGKHSPRGTEALIGHSPGQPLVGQHAGDVQILSYHGFVPTG